MASARIILRAIFQATTVPVPDFFMLWSGVTESPWLSIFRGTERKSYNGLPHGSLGHENDYPSNQAHCQGSDSGYSRRLKR
eukprot:scaffold276_cov132-Cylindrotheca_fusiformis.AAC.21